MSADIPDFSISLSELIDLTRKSNDHIPVGPISDDRIKVAVMLDRMGVPEDAINSIDLEQRGWLLAFLTEHPLPAGKMESLTQANASIYLKYHVKWAIEKFITEKYGPFQKSKFHVMKSSRPFPWPRTRIF